MLTHVTCTLPFRIKVHFKDSKGQLLKTVEANEGDDILSIAHEYDIDLEGTSLPLVAVAPRPYVPILPCSLFKGACEGSVACSTCHVILDPEHYDLLPEAEVSLSTYSPCLNSDTSIVG